MNEFIIKAYSDPTVRKILIVFAGIIVINIFVRILRRYFSNRIGDTSTRYRIRKFITFIGYLIALLFILTIFQEHLKNIHVAIGIAGAGLAFSLQEVIVSFAGWITISFGNFYRTGDRVQLGGIQGDVIDIGMLRTTLMECGAWVRGDQYNGRIVRVANSFVFKEPVFNYSSDFPFIWDEVHVPVKYGSDIRRAKEIFLDILHEITGDYTNYARSAWEGIVKKYMIEKARVDPAVTMSANDNWIEYTLRYVVDYKKRRSTKDLIYTRMLEEIEKTDGRISIASATVQVTEFPPLKIKTLGERQ